MNLLGSANYDPAAAVSKATSALLAMTALDTTNLRLAITVPAHGKVLFRLKCNIAGATTMPAIILGAMNGATVLGRQVPAMNTDTQSAATHNAYAWAEFIATGLAPGAMNVDAAYAVQVVVAATNIKYGGPNTNAGANAWGGFVFEAWDPTPLPTAAPGVANGLLIAGANAATTFATLTSTAAFTINGTSNVAQTGDSFARLGAPVGASHSADVAAVQADTDNIQTRLPTTLVSGRIDCSVGAMAANVLTATAINADAITAAKIADASIDAATFAAGAINAAAIAADAITDAKVASDVTIASVTGAVGSVTGAVTVGTNNDKTGYALSAAGVQAIWDALTSALTTVGSIGKRLADNVDAAVSSRMATYTQPSGFLAATFPGTVASPTNITAGTIATVTNLTNAPTSGDFTAVMKTSLNAATPAVTVSDKTGFSLSAAGVQAIWDALTSALTTVGSVGKRIADNIDATISSRLATSGYTAPPTVAVIADGVWDEVLSGHLTATTTGAALNGAGSAGDPWTTALPGAYGAGTAGNIVGNRLDAAITTRLATAGYTAPDNADIVAIKNKTDNLPTDPADASDIVASFGTVAAQIAALNNLSAAGVRSAVGLASANLDTQLDALPTNAELTTALAGADDATLAAIAALLIPTTSAIADEVATRTLKANILKINDVTLKGVGTSGDQWGPV